MMMMTKENTKRKDRKLDKKQKQVQATESRKQYSSKNSLNSSSSSSFSGSFNGSMDGSFNGSKENGKDGDEYKSQCRMYEATMPVPGDFVMVQVKEHIEAGAYVSLPEYGGITGLILLEEASRLRARSISQVLQMGLQDVAVVIRTDPAKGYIDLSRKRVKSEERQKCLDKYYRSKLVHTILRAVAQKCKKSLLELYQTFVWDLYRRFGHAYNAFSQLLNQERNVQLVPLKESKESKESVTLLDKYDLAPMVRETLMQEIKRRIVMEVVKVRAEFHLECFFHVDGIEAIKAAIRAGLAHATTQIPLTVKLKVPPRYVIETTCTDPVAGEAVVLRALDSMKQSIETKRGNCTVVVPPQVPSKEGQESQEEDGPDDDNSDNCGDGDNSDNGDNGDNGDADDLLVRPFDSSKC